jgi:hypothetical protein
MSPATKADKDRLRNSTYRNRFIQLINEDQDREVLVHAFEEAPEHVPPGLFSCTLHFTARRTDAAADGFKVPENQRERLLRRLSQEPYVGLSRRRKHRSRRKFGFRNPHS